MHANWLRDEEAQALVAEVRDLESTITRYNRLAWPVRVSDAIAALSPLVPESTTLRALTLTPKGEKSRRGRSKDEPARSVLAIEIEGIAPTDIEVARFVSGLDAHPLFAGVSMAFARSVDVDGTPGREFRVHCEIDLTRRYRFVEAPDGEGL